MLGLVHTTAEKFENTALFLRLGLPSTLIRHENEALRKRSANRRNLKTSALRFSVDKKIILKTELFDSDKVTVIITMISYPSFL